ncbi:MAG: alpha-hydroxy-acid oxidizing protein, partial [Actinobacteria bacterium]|nr:alpha-hydroxy-acid oxidizing protein [Actinomycetota bacterium]
RRSLAALVADGEEGVDTVPELLRSGLERWMGLVGASSVDELGAELPEWS